MIYCYTYGKSQIAALTRSCAANYAEYHGNFSRLGMLPRLEKHVISLRSELKYL